MICLTQTKGDTNHPHNLVTATAREQKASSNQAAISLPALLGPGAYLTAALRWFYSICLCHF